VLLISLEVAYRAYLDLIFPVSVSIRVSSLLTTNGTNWQKLTTLEIDLVKGMRQLANVVAVYSSGAKGVARRGLCVPQL